MMLATPQGSVNSSTYEDSEIVSCFRADSFPDASEPNCICCMVCVRRPAVENICWRERTSFTGRSTSLAAIQVITVLGQENPLEPKPPPMYDETSRIFSCGTPSIFERRFREPKTDCVESYTISSSPFH